MRINPRYTAIIEALDIALALLDERHHPALAEARRIVRNRFLREMQKSKALLSGQ
jgi:hypothetical protein